MTITVSQPLDYRVGPKGYIHGWIKVGDPMGSLAKHTRNGTLSKSREQLHSQIVDKLLEGKTAVAHPTATFLGGGPASGKSSVFGEADPNSVHIDADAIKGMLPEYQDLMRRGKTEAAAYAHEESSLIAKRAMREASQRHLNYTLDGTGDSDYDKLLRKISEARQSGHKVVAHYVTVDTDEAIKRSNLRAAKTGRMVPESTVRAIHQGVTDTFKKAVEHNVFDEVTLHDNNGTSPTLVGEKTPGGQWTVQNRAAWQRFLAKGTS